MNIELKIKKLLKDIKSNKPLKYSLYINKNGITLIHNKYYTGVSHYELYGTHIKPKKMYDGYEQF